jgi:hypothetical protein
VVLVERLVSYGCVSTASVEVDDLRNGLRRAAFGPDSFDPEVHFGAADQYTIAHQPIKKRLE